MATCIWIGTNAGNEGDWATAANWSGAAVPVTGDNVYLEASSQSVTAGFAQSAVTLASLNIAQSFTGSIGDADDYLAISATLLNIGYNYGPGTPAGSPLIKLALGLNASTVTIFNTGTSSDSTKPPVRITATHASNVLEVRKGKVGVAIETGETSQFATITASYTTQKTTDSDVYIGSGVTLATLDQRGGDVVMRCGATTVTVDAGTLTTEESGAITTLTVNGGTVTSNSSGTITTLAINGGTVDFTKNGTDRTVTNLKLNPGGTLKHDPSDTTFTNWTEPDNPVVLSATAA